MVSVTFKYASGSYILIPFMLCQPVLFLIVHEGEYKLHLQYGGVHIQGSPFTVMAYDLSRVKVIDIHDGIVGQETSFKSS